MLDGPEAALLVVVMAIGCLALWIVIPVGWLWIGSQVEGSADLSTGLAVAMFGSMVSICTAVVCLTWLNRRHLELQRRRKGAEQSTSVLELLLVASASIAVAIFAVWFLIFAGTSPAPLNISY